MHIRTNCSYICHIKLIQRKYKNTMGLQIISDKAVQAIRNDNNLYAAVAEALGIKLASLPNYLIRKSEKLSNIGIVNIIAEKTGMPVEDIVETEAVIAG